MAEQFEIEAYCPFCGESEFLQVSNNDLLDEEVRFTFVSCQTCAASGPQCDDDEQLAIEAWNKRSSEPNTRSTDERVVEFAREIVELAHEGDIDSGQVYELGTRTGIIRIEDKIVPCVSDDSELCCKCAEYAEHGEVVDCYRLNPELFPACKPSEEEVK